MVVVYQGSRLIYRLLVRAQVAAWDRRTNIVPVDAPVYSLYSSSSVLGSGMVSHGVVTMWEAPVRGKDILQR